MKEFDIIVVGAGISGATLAERYAKEKGKRVLIIDQRNHVGGNCYDFYNDDGVLVPKYGPHFFHTNYEEVWTYVNRFSEWIRYEHRVLSSVEGKLVPVPVNIATINELFGLSMQTEVEMKAWLKLHVESIVEPQNSEESALARVGPVLYEKMFKSYTKKQWDLWPQELDALVMNRIPVRTTFDDRYFTDVHQAMPKEGYTNLFERMLSHANITVRLNTSWDSLKAANPQYEKLFFTGPIDHFFNYSLGEKLQYRSLRFEYETHDMPYFQSRAQINYPNLSVPYTRITEPKHATGQKHPKTTIIKEFSTWDGEPYYPVPTDRNRLLYEGYQKKAEKLERDSIFFAGRLANYKYFNMDQAFKNALDLFAKLES